MEKRHLELLDKINGINDPQMKISCRVSDRTTVVSIIKEAQVILFPGYYTYNNLTQEKALHMLAYDLEKEILAAQHLSGDNSRNAFDITHDFLTTLPEIKKLLLTDIQAIYDGDPAAKSKAEVLICYPGFYAITIYRFAHVLYQLKVPFIPRIMTEYAHEKTGIDINPGAVIGDHFCIDHGTGVVIGETAVLGHHVKLYQGVTIGAKSFDLDENGNPVKSGKRHPDIGNHVVVYANATILGGNTHIGNNCVIGGNVWLMHSVADNQTVYYTEK